jgi:hypothetical protein
MKKVYLVTQHKSDTAIFEKLLSEKIVDKVFVVEGAGRSSARSLAASILAVKQRPVALIVDADTTDADDIQAQKYMLRELLYRASPGIPFEVFLAAPEIEAVFLQDRSFIERLANRQFSDAEWQAAALHPKKFLSDILKEEDQVSAKILEKSDEHAIHAMQKHPLLSDVCNFLSSVIDGKN